MSDDIRQDQFNKFGNLPNVSYNCIKYLMDNDEDIWKCLRYNEADCWNRDSLTAAEKGGLVYAGQPNATDFRVFMDPGVDDTWTTEACILRVFPTTLLPSNYITGKMGIGFEVYSHYKINHLSNYKTRNEFVAQRIFEVINGAEIDDIGKVWFDQKSRSVAIGGIPFKGRAIVFYNHTLGA